MHHYARRPQDKATIRTNEKFPQLIIIHKYKQYINSYSSENNVVCEMSMLCFKHTHTHTRTQTLKARPKKH